MRVLHNRLNEINRITSRTGSCRYAVNIGFPLIDVTEMFFIVHARGAVLLTTTVFLLISRRTERHRHRSLHVVPWRVICVERYEIHHAVKSDIDKYRIVTWRSLDEKQK